MVTDSLQPGTPSVALRRSALTWRAIVLCCTLLVGCAGPAPHEMLNAALWHHSAAEYRALALQTYALALQRLEDGLATARWTAALEQTGDLSGLPPAVVMDIDETVIDNSRYEARIVTELGDFRREDFERWCQGDGAGAVPGAQAFIQAARERGVRVFFLSARWESLRACTLRSLERLGVGPVDDEELHLWAPGGKARVRAQLARDYRILLLLGDNLDDFVSGSRVSAASRNELMRRHAERFGRTWILFPNAAYGHWEALYYDFDYARPRAEKLRRKREALR